MGPRRCRRWEKSTEVMGTSVCPAGHKDIPTGTALLTQLWRTPARVPHGRTLAGRGWKEVWRKAEDHGKAAGIESTG